MDNRIMRILLTPDQMRKVDDRAINEYLVPGSILMENAAMNSAKMIKRIIFDSNLINPNVLVLCGSGNNGGDGFAIARHLIDYSSVKIYWIGDESKMSFETNQNYNICKKIGLPVSHITTIKDLNKDYLNFEVLIDAMIGVGGSENIKGVALDILKVISNYNGIKIAIDIPTGLNSENGLSSEFTFKSDYTITMYAPKIGMYLNNGFEFCGKVLVANLGVPLSISEDLANNFILDSDSAKNLLPRRKKISSKFDFGKVVVIAGSKQYPGAAALSSNAAIKSGAGLVYLLSTCFHSSLLPEVIPVELQSNIDGTISQKSNDIVKDFVEKADSVVIGPGLSSNPETISLIAELISSSPKNKKIVIDADGLRAITPDLKLSENIILTPHIGEFSRLIKNYHDKNTINDRNNTAENINYYQLLTYYSSKLNCIIHLKWVPSITTDGKKYIWNIYGNSGMASGGSGDVLSGVIGGLLAQGMNSLEGTALGAFIHSKAGDYASKYLGMNSMTASDLIHFLPQIFKQFEINE